jgi:hypothetical protein
MIAGALQLGSGVGGHVWPLAQSPVEPPVHALDWLTVTHW